MVASGFHGLPWAFECSDSLTSSLAAHLQLKHPGPASRPRQPNLGFANQIGAHRTFAELLSATSSATSTLKPQTTRPVWSKQSIIWEASSKSTAFVKPDVSEQPNLSQSTWIQFDPSESRPSGRCSPGPVGRPKPWPAAASRRRPAAPPRPRPAAPGPQPAPFLKYGERAGARPARPVSQLGCQDAQLGLLRLWAQLGGANGVDPSHIASAQCCNEASTQPISFLRP